MALRDGLTRGHRHFQTRPAGPPKSRRHSFPRNGPRRDAAEACVRHQVRLFGRRQCDVPTGPSIRITPSLQSPPPAPPPMPKYEPTSERESPQPWPGKWVAWPAGWMQMRRAWTPDLRTRLASTRRNSRRYRRQADSPRQSRSGSSHHRRPRAKLDGRNVARFSGVMPGDWVQVLQSGYITGYTGRIRP